MAGRLGDILVRRGAITSEQLERALSTPGMLGDNLVELGYVTPAELGSALAEQFEVPYEELDPNQINPQFVRLLPEPFARERNAVPIFAGRGAMKLAMVAPDDIETISEVELMTGYRVEPLVTMEDEVQAVMDRGFDDRIDARQTIIDMKLVELAEAKDVGDVDMAAIPEEEDAPVIRLVRAILMGSINAGASDIHLEPHSPEMRVRYRVDGELQQVMTIPNHIEDAVVARIKVMADMDTTETRRPQDGHLGVHEDGVKVNFRVSNIPTVGGEKVVLRLLDEGNKVFDLAKIGFMERDLQRIQSVIDKPHGMFVVTGPTGSGKSTTLYAVLTKLNEICRNIVTVEDPVEFRLPGVNQVQSDNEFGMGFANALKFIMRQDPDVIMVGEIRDHETATTAVQAALTGHLLISTLHTNDAVGAVARLNDLGIDYFKIGGSLLGGMAQRLLRAVCPDCREPVELSGGGLIDAIQEHVTLPEDATFYQGAGCKKCLNSGYRGRMPVFEIMVVTPELSSAIERGLPTTKLADIAREEGMLLLAEAGVEQAALGRTTLEEVYYKTLGQ